MNNLPDEIFSTIMDILRPCDLYSFAFTSYDNLKRVWKHLKIIFTIEKPITEYYSKRREKKLPTSYINCITLDAYKFENLPIIIREVIVCRECKGKINWIGKWRYKLLKCDCITCVKN